VLIVQFRPGSQEFLFRDRVCVSSYDNNVGLELTGQRHGSFVYDHDCGRLHYSDPNGCRFDGFHQQPCPPVYRVGEFRLNPGAERFELFRLFDLARRALWGPPLEAGQLTVGETRLNQPP
jgi:hypothetical protein